MPTYDRPSLIIDSVNSILKQDYENWELIIKDGGTYDIFDLVPKDKRIIYIYGKDAGITHAVNQAFTLATGHIFHWFNDDDVMAPGTLSFVAENMEEYAWLYGRVLMTQNPLDSDPIGEIWGEDWDYDKLCTQYNFVPQPASFWTEKASWMVGPFDDMHDLTSDYDYWIRMGNNYTPKVVNRILAYYRVHPGQITHKNNPEQARQAEETRKRYIEFGE